MLEEEYYLERKCIKRLYDYACCELGLHVWTFDGLVLKDRSKISIKLMFTRTQHTHNLLSFSFLSFFLLTAHHYFSFNKERKKQRKVIMWAVIEERKGTPSTAWHHTDLMIGHKKEEAISSWRTSWSPFLWSIRSVMMAVDGKWKVVQHAALS